MRVFYTHVSLLLHVPMFPCAHIHNRQSITVTGNDTGYSPPSSVLHVGLMVSLTYTCSHRGIYVTGFWKTVPNRTTTEIHSIA